MHVKQCKLCGKLFQSLGNPICMECEERLDQEFRIVRDYLYGHPDEDIAGISKETGVSEKSILQFLKEERLSLHGPSENIRCEHCGKAIPSGKLCMECKDKLSQMFESMVEANAARLAQKKESDSMGYQGRKHFDNNRR